MKVVAYIACPLLLILTGFFFGFAVNVKRLMAEHLAEKGFTKDSAGIYRRCIKLLNRMTRITELDGDFAEDILSEATKAEIASILDAHRKDLNTR